MKKLLILIIPTILLCACEDKSTDFDVVYKHETRGCICAYHLYMPDTMNAAKRQGVNITKLCGLTKSACLNQKDPETIKRAAKIIRKNYANFECSDHFVRKAFNDFNLSGINLNCPNINSSSFMNAAME